MQVHTPDDQAQSKARNIARAMPFMPASIERSRPTPGATKNISACEAWLPPKHKPSQAASYRRKKITTTPPSPIQLHLNQSMFGKHCHRSLPKVSCVHSNAKNNGTPCATLSPNEQFHSSKNNEGTPCAHGTNPAVKLIHPRSREKHDVRAHAHTPTIPTQIE